MDWDTPQLCPSSEPHGPETINDPVEHYWSCIKISDRPKFFDKKLNCEFWDHQRTTLANKLVQRKSTQLSWDEDLEEQLDKVVLSLATSIDNRYRRVSNLRNVLSAVDCSPYLRERARELGPSCSQECKSVEYVTNSRRRWMSQIEFRRGVAIIRSRNVSRESFDSDVAEGRTPDSCVDPGHLAARRIINRFAQFGTEVNPSEERDANHVEANTNAYVIQWEVLSNENVAVPISTSADRNEDRASDTPNDVSTKAPEPPKADVNRERYGSSPEKYMSPVDGVHPALKGHFPNQTISLSHLLSPGPFPSVLSRQQREGHMMQYIHIPYNNMEWVEAAIARYFDEETTCSGDAHEKYSFPTQSSMVLRYQDWKGQQYGGDRALAHARQMRPLCKRTSSKIWDTEDNPNHIVVFMPFLHWEEDRKRAQISKAMEDQSRIQRQKQKNFEHEARQRRLNERKVVASTHGPNLPEFNLVTRTDSDTHRAVQHGTYWKAPGFGYIRMRQPTKTPKRTFTELAGGLVSIGETIEEEFEQSPWTLKKLKSDTHGRIQAEGLLGQFLLDAARLYEAMSMHREKQILERYLHHEPPLHPRRTLDQSADWTMQSHQSREKDQVVYRSTEIDKRNIHSLRTRKTPRTKQDRQAIDNGDPEKHIQEPAYSPFQYAWDDHSSRTKAIGCEHCRTEIRKVPKVIMVDQLWMWILDKNTILTSFPQRYGEDRQNASGVHKSIRRRLEQAKSNQIRSVFDLALVILDECANDVFNQEAAQDPKPPIIDIFSRSIGDLAHRQKLSRDGLRELTASASLLHKSTPQKARRIVQQLTRVNFEGLFLDDITKIVDELNIMINNSRQHRDIIGKFIQHAENILNPEGLLKDEKSRAFDTADSIASPSENGKFSTSSTETRLAIDQFFWFQRQAGDLLIRVDNRITELLGLLNRAEKTSKAINELHTLILQQASVLQAWQAGEEVGESLQHGRSIMVFTIVTIIFLPLSFMSSVFGMNNSNIGDNQMSFREQANYMFPISAGVILISIIFAFWRFPRTIFWSAYKVTETWLLVNTGLYGLWLYLVEKSQFFKIDVLLNKLEQNIEEMKEEVRKRRMKKRMG